MKKKWPTIVSFPFHEEFHWKPKVHLKCTQVYLWNSLWIVHCPPYSHPLQKNRQYLSILRSMKSQPILKNQWRIKVKSSELLFYYPPQQQLNCEKKWSCVGTLICSSISCGKVVGMMVQEICIISIWLDKILCSVGQLLGRYMGKREQNRQSNYRVIPCHLHIWS